MIVIVLALISCSTGNDMAEIITENLMEENNNSVLEGTFVSEAHPTSGTASINSARTELKFTNFMTDSGPLLEVWLSKQQALYHHPVFCSFSNYPRLNIDVVLFDPEIFPQLL